MWREGGSVTGCKGVGAGRGVNGAERRKEVNQDQREGVGDAGEAKGEAGRVSKGSMKVTRSPCEQERV